MEEHTKNLEEAKKRDHRVLGPALGLFTIDDQVGQGLVLWKPKGAEVRIQLQNFISEHLRRQGYKQVFTPHIGRLDLYRTSGHYPYYRESQFPPLIDREQIELLSKENCGCAELANRMEKGEIRLHARDTTEPSPFSHEILNAKPYAYLDDAPLEERRTRAVSLRRTLPENQRDLGALDPDAIARVVAEAEPSPRDADELHDVLLGLVAARVRDGWRAWYEE